jgi:CRISPR-associated protein Cas2
MKVLVAYDVCTSSEGGAKRLRLVARACKDYGQRVQKSLFECMVGDADWVRLRGRLLEEMDAKLDSLLFYFLDADIKVEHHGIAEVVDPEAPLVI